MELYSYTHPGTSARALNNWENLRNKTDGKPTIFESIGNEISKLWNGLTGETSAQATRDANQMNIENQNYWNEIAMQREDTAHQREVADLHAAGLNPWLSVSGSGASATTMSTAQAEPADGSKILQATTAMALLALSKIASSKIGTTKNITSIRL